jgi:hypothetical protein
MRGVSCADCTYFDKKSLLCRRHPPAVVVTKPEYIPSTGKTTTHLVIWPAVAETDWCGDYIAEEPETPPA